VYDSILVPHLSPALTVLRNRLLPIMISRLMLSLKKASKAGESGWTSNVLSRTHRRTITQIAFRVPLSGPEDSGGTVSEEVELSVLGGGRVRGRGDEMAA